MVACESPTLNFFPEESDDPEEPEDVSAGLEAAGLVVLLEHPASITNANTTVSNKTKTLFFIDFPPVNFMLKSRPSD